MSPQDKIEQELRERYGRDVPILREMPSREEIVAKDSLLQRLAGLAGVQSWMWRSRWGWIIALIVVPPTVNGYIDYYGPILETAYEYAEPYLGALKSTTVPLGNDLVAFQSGPFDESAFETPPTLIIPNVQHEIVRPPGEQPFVLQTTLWRYVHSRFADSQIDGRGTMMFDGRWHSRGVPLLYTSDSMLAAVGELQRFIGGDDLDLPQSFRVQQLRVRVLAEIAPPEAVRAVADADVARTRAIGDDWIRSRRSGALLAPSPVDPSSNTVVLNLAMADEIQLNLVQVFDAGPIGEPYSRA